MNNALRTWRAAEFKDGDHGDVRGPRKPGLTIIRLIEVMA